jgi:carboxyl-terminal processing protease
MKDEDGYFTKIPDSLVNEFKTSNGRLVYDGGGIIPDISLAPHKFSHILRSLVSKHLIFDYATIFESEHPEIASAEDFEISDEIYNDFVAFLSDKDYDYETTGERKLKEMKEALIAEGKFDEFEGQYEQLITAIMHNKEEDLVTYRDEISTLLKLEIISRYYYQKGEIEASLKDDPEISKAIEIIDDPSTYKSILEGTFSGSNTSLEKDDPKKKG